MFLFKACQILFFSFEINFLSTRRNIFENEIDIRQNMYDKRLTSFLHQLKFEMCNVWNFVIDEP